MQGDAVQRRGAAPAKTGEEYRNRALNDVPACVFVLNDSGRVVFANQAACDIMEFDGFVGRPFAEYFMVCPNSANDRFYDVVLQAVRDKTTQQNARCLFVSNKGTRYAFAVTSSFLEREGEGSFLVVTCTDVTPEERADRTRREATFILISTIVYICLYLFAYATWDFLGRPGFQEGLTRVVEVGGLILGLFAFRHTALRHEDLGLGFANIGKILLVDGLISLGLLGVLALIKLALMRLAPGLIQHPEAFFMGGWVSVPRFAGCLLTAFVQEFLTRSILQQSLLHILQGRHRKLLAIGISTIMFTSLHMVYGPLYMLGAALLLGGLGFVYDRQKSIWGLVLIHFVVVAGAMMLGLV